MGCSKKKSKKGKLRTWNLKKLKKQNMEIPGVNKKRCGISIGSGSLVFGLGNSNAMAMGVMQFCGISRGEIVSGISKS